MVLPKNVTQIGEISGNCKIYVEDYVISYIKQLAQAASDKTLAVAIYGIRKEEMGVDYLFVYGSAQLDYLSRECRHLSQAQLQEIDRNRKKYFGEYSFLGYGLLTGEIPDGFYIYEQGICRYTGGYARFYEKNDVMLAFMLDNRLMQASPEVVDISKYETVRNRQEERKKQTYEEEEFRQREAAPVQVNDMAGFQYRFAKTAMGAVLGMAAVLGVAVAVQEQKGGSVLWNEITAVASGILGGSAEETEEAVAAMAEGQVDKLVIEERLNQVLLEENMQPEQESLAESSVEEESLETESIAEDITDYEPESDSSEPVAEVSEESTAEQETTATVVNVDAESLAEEQIQTQDQQVASYTVMPGDTLIGISTRLYGTEARVQEICKLNRIGNPDDIKVGTEILLP